MDELYKRLSDSLYEDRKRTDTEHGAGAWDVADVMAIVWPEIERLIREVSPVR